MKPLLVMLVVVVFASPAAAATMTLNSPDVAPNGTIGNRFTLNGFGCHGENVTPRLTWSGVPTLAKSLAVSVFDPDAETTIGFVQWLVVDIPPTATSSESMSGAVEALTDFGKPGYGGPCPPVGDSPHHYIFTLWALDTAFPFDAHTTYAVFRFSIRGHVLGTAQFTGRYGR